MIIGLNLQDDCTDLSWLSSDYMFFKQTWFPIEFYHKSRSPSLGVYNYPNYSCSGVFTDRSIFSLNLPRIIKLSDLSQART